MDDLDFPSVEHTNNFVYYSSDVKPSNANNKDNVNKTPIRKVSNVTSVNKLSKEEREKLRKRKYHKALAKGLLKRGSTFVAISLALGIGINKLSKKDRADIHSDVQSEPTYESTVKDYENNNNNDIDERIRLEENYVSNEEAINSSNDEYEVIEEQKEYEEFANQINAEFDNYYEYAPANVTFDDDNIMDSVYTYKEINANIDAYAVRYCEQIVYDKIMNLFGDDILTFSNMYGVDPIYVASLIMVEVPDYDIEKDDDPSAIGVGQYKGHLFEGDIFTAYNFEKNIYESVTFKTDELLKKPKNQIKLLCMDIARVGAKYDYNLYAMLEHHNKGEGSVGDALDILKEKYNLSSRDEVLKIVDPTEISDVIQKIGDPNYTSKALTYMDMCLKQHAFNRDTISFQRPNGEPPVVIGININSYSRS